jgi:hypothetical protein
MIVRPPDDRNSSVAIEETAFVTIRSEELESEHG